jgi:hypothetical protein
MDEILIFASALAFLLAIGVVAVFTSWAARR